MLGQYTTYLYLRNIAFVILVAVLVLSCNESKSPETYDGEVARVINAKVENYTAGQATLEATSLLSDIKGIDVVIGTGNIEANGNFKFSYKKLENINTNEFSPITDLACKAIIPDEQETTRFILSGDIRVLSQGGGIFWIVSLSRQSASDFQFEVNDYIVMRIIVDKDVTIQGSCKDYFELMALEDYNLELKKGWNIVVLTVTSVDSEEGFVTSLRIETKPVPSGTRWWFIKAE